MSNGTYFMVILLTSILGDVGSEVLSGGSKSLMSKPRKPCKVPSSKEYYYMSMEGVRLEPNESIDGCGKVAAEVKCFNPTRIVKPVDFAVCFDEQWYPSHHTCEQKKCHPLHDSYSTVYSCTTPKGVKVSCGSPAVPGTKVTIRCASWRYQFSKSPDIRVREKFCLESGEWEKIEEICKEQCGLVFNNETNNNSSLKVLNDYPWHVIIYRYENDEWNQFCVGTLLTNFLVLTAYDCFSNWYEKGKRIRVAVGKYYKHYNGTDTSSRMYDVDKIYWYQEKIVSLVIGEYIEFSDTVGSVCWPYEYEMQLNGSMYPIVVWGKDEKGFTARVAKTYLCVLHTNCPSTDEKLVFDQFCCQSNEHKFVPEDMGSGLVGLSEVDDDRQFFYLVGIFNGILPDGQTPVFIDVMDGRITNFITYHIGEYKVLMKEKYSHLRVQNKDLR